MIAGIRKEDTIKKGCFYLCFIHIFLLKEPEIIISGLFIFMIDSKVLSLLLELLHFQETHHRFHQYDRSRRFLKER